MICTGSILRNQAWVLATGQCVPGLKPTCVRVKSNDASYPPLLSHKSTTFILCQPLIHFYVKLSTNPEYLSLNHLNYVYEVIKSDIRTNKHSTLHISAYHHIAVCLYTIAWDGINSSVFLVEWEWWVPYCCLLSSFDIKHFIRNTDLGNDIFNTSKRF